MSGTPTCSGIMRARGCCRALFDAQEASWREDNRRISNGEQVSRVPQPIFKDRPSVQRRRGRSQLRRLSDAEPGPLGALHRSLNQTSFRHPSLRLIFDPAHRVAVRHKPWNMLKPAVRPRDPHVPNPWRTTSGAPRKLAI
jgi:hypothetical protein